MNLRWALDIPKEIAETKITNGSVQKRNSSMLSGDIAIAQQTKESNARK